MEIINSIEQPTHEFGTETPKRDTDDQLPSPQTPLV